MATQSEEIVDAMNALHGRHTGFRAAHAKGTFCRGTFTATPEAAALSRAPHLQGESVKVTARFSNGSGNPEARDCDRRDGRGLAVKFHLDGDESTDIVAISIPVFFVKTPEDFLEFLKAREPDPETGEMDMDRIGAYMAEHPETAAAVQLILPALSPPTSFATSRYNALHAFGFENGGGEQRFGRYSFIPDAGEQALPEDEIDGKPRDYLQEEIRERIGSGPVGFELVVQLAEDGDATDDPTVAWPEEREQVSIGRLELTEIADDAETPGAPLVFDPVNVVDGIELSDDKIPQARSDAYSVSVERRMASA